MGQKNSPNFTFPGNILYFSFFQFWLLLLFSLYGFPNLPVFFVMDFGFCLFCLFLYFFLFFCTSSTASTDNLLTCICNLGKSQSNYFRYVRLRENTDCGLKKTDTDCILCSLCLFLSPVYSVTLVPTRCTACQSKPHFISILVQFSVYRSHHQDHRNQGNRICCRSRIQSPDQSKEFWENKNHRNAQHKIS